MAFKDEWKDLKDATVEAPNSGDDISVEPINKIAHQVILNEENIIDKVDKEDGKGLSSNDFTTEYKEKVDKLGEQVQNDWSQNDETQPNYIKNRPFYIERKVEEATETIFHFIDELSYSDNYDYHYKDNYKYGLIENNLYNLQITAYLEGNVVAEETLENVPAIHSANEILINTEEFKDENGLPFGEIDVVINDTNVREWSYCQVINSPQYDEILIKITGVLNHNTYVHAPSREILNVILAGGVDYENLGLDCQDILATKDDINIKQNELVEYVDTKQEELFEYEYSPNLLDLNSLNVGKYLSSSGGLASNTSYNTTDYIPCNAGDVIRHQFTYGGVRYDADVKLNYAVLNFVAAYDESKKFIAGSHASSKTKYTVPEGASFVRVTFSVSNWNNGGRSDAAIVICDNPVIFPYSEYGSVLRKSIKTEYAPNGIVKAFLPKEICVAVGRTIELYNNQVCINSDKYHMQWDCSIGLALDRKFSVTGTTDLIGEHLLILYIKDDDLNTVWWGSTVVKIVPATSESFSMCCIGDSLTNNKPWLIELKVLNSNISFVGTCGTAPYNHEGRSGFRASDYLRTTAGVTPFWNPTAERFDWNYYVTNSLGGVSPDAVQIFLGTNGIESNATNNANYIKQMVDYIRQDDANIPIFLVNTLYRSNQSGIARQSNTDGYVTKQGEYKYMEDYKVLKLMIDLNTLLDGYENVYFVPVATCHDSANNFGKVEVTINPRSTDKEYVPVEGTHPQEQGYLQMADIMFSSLSAHMDLT